MAADLTAVMRRAWDKHGTAPNALFESVTPSQFVALFTEAPPVALDRVAALRAHNDARGRKGLRPVVPSWL